MFAPCLHFVLRSAPEFVDEQHIVVMAGGYGLMTHSLKVRLLSLCQ
jgi:hypothetical protein